MGDLPTNFFSFFDGSGHIDQQIDAAGILSSGQHFNYSIGIGHGSRFRGSDHENLIGGHTESNYVLADAGAGIDENDIGAILKTVKLMDQPMLKGVRLAMSSKPEPRR